MSASGQKRTLKMGDSSPQQMNFNLRAQLAPRVSGPPSHRRRDEALRTMICASRECLITRSRKPCLTDNGAETFTWPDGGTVR